MSKFQLAFAHSTHPGVLKFLERRAIATHMYLIVSMETTLRHLFYNSSLLAYVNYGTQTAHFIISTTTFFKLANHRVDGGKTWYTHYIFFPWQCMPIMHLSMYCPTYPPAGIWRGLGWGSPKNAPLMTGFHPPVIAHACAVNRVPHGRLSAGRSRISLKQSALALAGWGFTFFVSPRGREIII